MKRYILDENMNPVECHDLSEWANWKGSFERIKSSSYDGWRISTVFLGLDHSHGTGKPILFETMAFGRDNDAYYMDRCCTYDECEDMHNKAIEWLYENGHVDRPLQITLDEDLFNV